jgi:thiol-disulfide isomerase/thioredoxin
MSSENDLFKKGENYDDEQNIQEELGGKKRHAKKNHTKKHHNKSKKIIVIGKVYADWCGHCQALKPEWKKMKHHVHSKKGKLRVVFVEIEEKAIDHKLKQLKNEYVVDVEVNGYPTVFKIENGKVDYFNGNRRSTDISNWVLRGGGGDGNHSQQNDNSFENKMPRLMQDSQGGTRRHRSGKYPYRHNNNRYKGKYFDPNYNKYTTRRNQSTKSYYKHNNNRTKKSPGIFDFLLGK